MELAGPMGETCRQAGVLFVVNNSVEVAIACGADGVHVGQGDDPAHARDALGPGRVLGISVQSPEQAAAAEAAGADYLAVTVWATPTKPEALPLHIDGLRAVLAVTQLPVVGIGGIGVENAAEVMGAGASGVAVISAVAGARDPVAATRALKRLIEEVESSEGGR